MPAGRYRRGAVQAGEPMTAHVLVAQGPIAGMTPRGLRFFDQRQGGLFARTA